jgi:hypothetical protein
LAIECFLFLGTGGGGDEFSFLALSSRDCFTQHGFPSQAEHYEFISDAISAMSSEVRG